MIPVNLDFKHLKQTVSIFTVLQAKGLLANMKRRGDKLTGPCPIHDGDNRGAFVVNLTKNIWFCFTGCNTGGDVIKFVQMLDHRSYYQTACYLASLSVNQTVDEITPSPSDVVRPFQPFRRKLPLDPDTLFLKRKGILKSTACYFNTGLYHGNGFLSGCVGVRLHDIDGNPLGYAGRRLQPELIPPHGKWKFPKGLPKKQLLYNFHRVNRNLSKSIVVVECPWGVMRLAQIGIPAVAILGTNLSNIQQRLLGNIPRIILMLDADPAGLKASDRIGTRLKPYTTVRVVTLPEGLDPDDLTDQQLMALLKPFLL